MAYMLSTPFYAADFELLNGGSDVDGGRPFFGWRGSEPVTDTSTIPTQARQLDKKKVADFFVEDQVVIVSQKFKDCVEAVEPDTHQFFPIELQNKDGVPYEAKYFVLHVTQHVPCFDRFETDMFAANKSRKGRPYFTASFAGAGGVICMQAVGKRQMFSGDDLSGVALLVSDQLHAKFEKAKLFGDAFDGSTVREIDKDWILEEQRPEWVEWVKNHPEEDKFRNFKRL